MKKCYTSVWFPVYLVMVKMANGQNYLFQSPDQESIGKGDNVLCKTRNGEQPGTVSTSVIKVNSQDALDLVTMAAGVGRVEPIVAKLERKNFPGTATYIAGKGMEREIKEDDNSVVDTCFTVHIPRSDGPDYGMTC